MRLKKILTIFLTSMMMLSICENSFALVAEYTNGVREKKLNIEDYTELIDTGSENPFKVNFFAKYSSKHVVLSEGTSTAGKYIGNTANSTWIRYDGFDFGEREKKINSIKIKVAHPAGFAGTMRIYLLNRRDDKEIDVVGGTLNNIGETDFLIGKHHFSRTEVYGNGWEEPGEMIIEPELETLNGKYDILFVFSTTGQGNFFEFSFEAEENEEQALNDNVKSCSEIRKFSNADLYSWSTGYVEGKDYVSTTGRNKWLLYRDIDFGSDGIKNFHFWYGKEEEYSGYMRMYEVSDEIANGTEAFKLNVGELVGGKLIFECYISTSDNTTGWYAPDKKTIEILAGEELRGVKNVLITFDNNGLGNFYDFCFEKIQPVSLSNSGMVCYDEFIPFMSTDLKIGYRSSKDTKLRITLDSKIYEVIAKGTENFLTVELKGAILPGVHMIKIEPYDYIHINSIIVNKMKIKTAQTKVHKDYKDTPSNDYTEVEQLMRSSIVVNINSPVYFSKNAKRYINYENSKELPYSVDNTVYVPVETFAVMTGAYFEEQDDYCQVRFENTELYKKGEVLYRQDNGGKYNIVQNDLLIRNAKHYLPLRKYLEAAGKTVYEKDGIIIADNQVRVKKLCEEEIFAEISERYEELINKGLSGKTYFVAQTDIASDKNEGSKELPFKTLKKAAQIATAGDTVIIKEGIYRETLIPEKDGTAAHPIIFMAAEGENVVISALDELDSSYDEEDGVRVYELDNTLPDGRNQIFYESEALSEARYPNYTETETSKLFKRLELSPLWPTTGNIKKVTDENGVTDDNMFYCEKAKNLEDDYFAGATLVSFHGSAWGQATAKIISSRNGYLRLGDKTKYWWHGGKGTDDYAYITATKNVIDLPGEWYVDTDTKKLYIMPYEESDEYEIKQRQLCIDLKDRKFIQILGINTIGGGTRMNNSELCVLNGGEHKYISHYTYSNDQHYGFVDNADILDKDGAPFSGEMGMYLGGRDNAIINTNIKYSAASAIYATGVYGLMYNNHIEEAGYMGSYVTGIFVMPDAANGSFRDLRGGHSIYFNTVDKTGRAALEFSANEESSWFTSVGVTPFVACDIAYNVFSNASLTAKDTGNIYIHGVQIGDDEDKTKLRNNFIYDARSDDTKMNAGIYFDNWAQMAQVYENVLFFTEHGRQIEDSNSIYVQSAASFPEAFAVIDVWNNSKLKEKKKFPLEICDYPNGKRFRAGANSDCVNVTENEFLKKAVSVEELSTVDFEGKYNALVVSYKSDTYNTTDVIKVCVGAEESIVNLKADMTKSGVVASVVIPVNEYNGEKQVKIEYIEHNGTEILGVMPIVMDNREFFNVVGKTYGGDFESGDASIKLGPDSEHMLAYGTWNGKILVYDDVNISKTVDTAIVSYSSSAQNSGGSVKMYADNELLCEFTINKNSWEDYTPVYLKMNKVLQPGKYDIKFEFTGTGTQTSNFWWFGFESFENLVKDVYTDKVDIYNTEVSENIKLEYNGVIVDKNSQFRLDNYDFGEAGYFKLIADYDVLTEAHLKFKVTIEDAIDNLILEPQSFSGSFNGIPCEMLSKIPVEGVKNIKITFEGEGSAIIRSLRFYKTPIYFGEVDYQDGIVSGTLNGIQGKAIITVCSSDGKLKKITILDETNNSFAVAADLGDRLKFMCLNSLEELKPYCEAITHMFIQPQGRNE